MYINLLKLNDTNPIFVKPYNDKCPYPINQEVNQILFVDVDHQSWDVIMPSIDAVIALAAQDKIAILIFNNCGFMIRDYIIQEMKKKLYTQIEVELNDYIYENCLYFGQFNRGLIIDI